MKRDFSKSWSPRYPSKRLHKITERISPVKGKTTPLDSGISCNSIIIDDLTFIPSKEQILNYNKLF